MIKKCITKALECYIGIFKPIAIFLFFNVNCYLEI